MSTETVEKVDLRVDLSDMVECGWVAPKCSEEAAWRGTVPCCNMQENLCSEHRTEFLRQYWANYPDVSCFDCGVDPMPEAIWRPL